MMLKALSADAELGLPKELSLPRRTSWAGLLHFSTTIVASLLLFASLLHLQLPSILEVQR